VRVGNLLGARLDPWDRKTLALSAYFEGIAVAPHAGTTRYTYTVPTNRKAMLMVWNGYLMRDAVSGAPSFANVAHQLSLSGTAFIAAQQLINIAGAVNEFKSMAHPLPIFMSAADQISSLTSDASVGGTYAIHTALSLLEFSN
jgi:hypothetical protein